MAAFNPHLFLELRSCCTDLNNVKIAPVPYARVCKKQEGKASPWLGKASPWLGKASPWLGKASPWLGKPSPWLGKASLT